jgi:putative membrane protein
MGVVLLVLQVAGSGGTFPIQMTPPFFQKLYTWLPFTYGIGALREAVFGVLYTSLKKDILILFSYFIVFLIVGILFVSVNHKHIEKITHKLEESGITE